MAPSRTVNVLWWAGYFALAIWLQLHFPGVDALIPGIVLSCQEERPGQTFWLCVFAVIIQEGAGSLAFGGALLWYGLLMLLFGLGRLFFLTSSLFFVVLLALVLGAAHAAVLYALGALEGHMIAGSRLVQLAAAQALLIPPLYAAAALARKRFLHHEYGI